jgi:hypothetical protein
LKPAALKNLGESRRELATEGCAEKINHELTRIDPPDERRAGINFSDTDLHRINTVYKKP